ncbi:2Fe-2S iron-sulfur cluster-binding protein [Streptomyces sp. NPDC003280]|uniref:2Fe-2S iron-sulfur cluster-binding protein n=1 Tax=Streptomyces sp. NPDC003280 TaxID=3364680 RepID=UPI0036736902
MTDDQHGEGAPQSGGRWDPLPQGDYDDGATAFVKLPEGGIDALLSGDSPLAAPGHGYVPPRITAAPPDGSAGAWPAPDGGGRWPDPNAVHREPGPDDRFTYRPAATQQWTFEEPAAPPAPGHDVTGQWSIPVAGGDLPDESGEFTTSSLVEQWGGTPPATLPGGAPAPWATEAAGQPWGEPDPGAAPHQADAAPETDYAPHPAGASPQTDYASRPTDAAPQPEFAPHPADAAPGTEFPPRPEDASPAPEFAPHPADAAPGTEFAPHHADAAPEAEYAPRSDDASPAPGFAPPYDPAPAERAPEGPAGGPEGRDGPAGHQADPEAPEAADTAAPPAAADPAAPADPAGVPDAPADLPDGAEESGGHEDTGTATATTAPQDEAPADAAAAEAPDQDAAPGDDPAALPPHDDHPLASYVLRVNGADRPVTDAWIGESLLYVLRERLGLAGAKDGCSQGECGACNVQVDGRLVASCLVPAVTAAGSEVRTVEGLAADGQPSDVQRALARCGAVQCGFCVPGMAMTLHDLLEGNPAPTELETRQALCGNLCRCSGYRGVLDAVQEVVAEREAHAAGDEGADPDAARIPHQAGPGAGGVNPAAFESPGLFDRPGTFGAPGPHDQQYGQDGGQA